MTVLDDILDGVRGDLAVRPARTNLDDLKAIAATAADADRRGAVLRGPGVSGHRRGRQALGPAGRLAAISDPAALAEYGPAALHLSVLTEERRFGGSLADLVAVAGPSTSRAAKDFIVAATSCGRPRRTAPTSPAHRRRPRAEALGLSLVERARNRSA